MDGVEVDHATWPAWQRWIAGLAQLAGGVFFLLRPITKATRVSVAHPKPVSPLSPSLFLGPRN